MLVELKNGETLNGHLITCDTWMNLTLKEVVQTSPVCGEPSLLTSVRQLTTDRTGRRQVCEITRSLCQGKQRTYATIFDHRAPGWEIANFRVIEEKVTDKPSAQIKYLTVPEEIIDVVTENQKNNQGNFRGGRGGGQSRGDHGGRGGGDRGRGGRGGGRGGRGRGRGQQ